MSYPLNSTDRAALFSSSDWGHSGTYTPNGGEASTVSGVLVDLVEGKFQVEGVEVTDKAYLLTFNRDDLADPLRDARVAITGPTGGDYVGTTFLLGDIVEADEHEVTVRARTV